MKASDRDRLFKALLGHVPPIETAADDDTKMALKALHDCAAQDLADIEAIVEDMILAAIRGTFAHGCIMFPEGGQTECKCGALLHNGQNHYEKHVEDSILRPN